MHSAELNSAEVMININAIDSNTFLKQNNTSSFVTRISVPESISAIWLKVNYSGAKYIDKIFQYTVNSNEISGTSFGFGGVTLGTNRFDAETLPSSETNMKNMFKLDADDDLGWGDAGSDVLKKANVELNNLSVLYTAADEIVPFSVFEGSNHVTVNLEGSNTVNISLTPNHGRLYGMLRYNCTGGKYVVVKSTTFNTKNHFTNNTNTKQLTLTSTDSIAMFYFSNEYMIQDERVFMEYKYYDSGDVLLKTVSNTIYNNAGESKYYKYSVNNPS